MSAKPNILILEDDTFVRQALEAKLARFPCEVTACDCPEPAIKLLAQGYRPALILSDLDMPGMKGNEFCALVRQKYGSIPFVLVSGNPEVYGLGNLCKADRAYMKPLHKDDLEDLLHDVGVELPA